MKLCPEIEEKALYKSLFLFFLSNYIFFKNVVYFFQWQVK